MKLIRMSMENFMPYKGRTTLSFPLDEQRNVMLVFGDNMRGKTSLLNAIRWGFYGKAVGRHLRELPLHELHNKEAALEGDWTMEVGIEFEADGHDYSLLRRATKKAIVGRPSRPDDFSTQVLLKKDSIVVNGFEIETEINRFVPEQVSRFFLFDGELLQEYEELLIEGSEQGKGIKSAIEQVLGVPTLINGKSDVGHILRIAQRQQSKDLAHVQGLESQAQKQAMLQSRLDSYESDLERLRSDLSARRDERVRLEEELSKVDAIHRAKVKLDSAKSRQREVEARQDAIKSDRLSLMREAWRDLLQPKLRVRRTSLMEERAKIEERMLERSALNAAAKNLREMLETEHCPTCGQSFDSAHREKYGNELGELEVCMKGFQDNADDLVSIRSELKLLDRLVSDGAATRLRDLRNESKKLDIELTRLDNETEQLEEEIRGFDTADIARKRQIRDGLLREEGSLNRDIDLVQKDISSATNNLAVIARTLQSMPQARSSRSTALVNLAASVERIFSESIDILREKLRMHVQERASEAFKSLTTQKAYDSLEINENFGLKILDDRKSHVTIRSAGAEQIVALSLIDGLARTGRTAGPVVMDTPFGRLDLQHRDNILRYLPSTTSQLILLVHGGEIRPGDLSPIAQRIGMSYEIKEVNARHSRLERKLS
jgi:DNA sulfur modification protein DndD